MPAKPKSNLSLFRFQSVAAAVLAAVVAGCALDGVETKREVDVGFLPSAYSAGQTRPEPAGPWWRTIGNAELHTMVETALADNPSLVQARARVRKARAEAEAAGADRWPDLTASAGSVHGRQRIRNGAERTVSLEDYSLGLTSVYETDFWGKIRQEEEAALLSAEAAREDLNAAATAVAAQVAERWVRIVAQRMHRELLQSQLQANRTLLELVDLRFRNALASALDVFQQRQVVERSRARLPLVERTERLLSHELALLLGMAPTGAPAIATETIDLPDPVPGVGLPIQLLTARPDVRAALLRIRAADRRANAARADRLPGLRLTASGLFEAGEAALLLDNWLIRLVSSLTAPLLDGNRRRAAVDAAVADAEAAVAAFREVLLAAVGEVEDALAREETLRRHLDGLAGELAAAQRTLGEARSRYRNGLDDYLPVLTALLAVQGLEQDILDRRTELILARVDLHRALGGGAWAGEAVR